MKTPCKNSYDRGAKFRPKEKPQNDAREALSEVQIFVEGIYSIAKKYGLKTLENDPVQVGDFIQTIRTALEQGQRAQQIVDLMELGNDIAFVSELHGEFIYRTQHSLATMQDRDAIRDLARALQNAQTVVSRTNAEKISAQINLALNTHAETIKRAGGE